MHSACIFGAVVPKSVGKLTYMINLQFSQHKSIIVLLLIIGIINRGQEDSKTSQFCDTCCSENLCYSKG